MKTTVTHARSTKCVSKFDDNDSKIEVSIYDITSSECLLDESNKNALLRVKNEGKVDMNPIQRSMYRRLIYGINDLTPEEKSATSSFSLQIIVVRHIKAKKILNGLRMKKIYEPYDKLLMAIFPQYKVKNKDYMIDKLPDPYRKVSLKKYSLKKLNITVKDICDEFIKFKLLPNNFYSLSPETINL